MRLQWARHRKENLTPAWVGVGLGLLVLGAAGLVAERLPARFLPPCGFHLITGHPCPTCGATRMVLDLLHGRLAASFHSNPLLLLILAALVLWALAGLVARFAGRDLTIELSPREEKWFWLGLLVAFLLNWWYLWEAGI